MKVTSRLAKFLDKFRDQKQNPLYWQKKYFSVVERLAEPVIEIKNNKIVYINKSARQLLYIPPEFDSPNFNDLFYETISSETLKKSNFTLQSKINKEVFHISILDLNSSGDLILTMTQVKSQELNKIKENEILKDDEIYREIYNSSIDCIFLHDYETGKLIDVNQTVLDRYGYTKEAFLNLQIEDISFGISPYSQKEANELLERIKKEKLINFEWYGKKKNGELTWSMNRMKVAHIHEKNFILVLSTDITYERNAKEELLKTKMMLETILNTIPERVFWKDLQLRFLGSNKKFLEDAGLDSIEQILGKTDADMPWGKLAKRYQDDDREVISKNKSLIGIEEPLKTTDGKEIWLKTNKIPLKNLAGEIVGVLGSFNDITDLKNSLIELEKHKNHLEELILERTEEIAIVNNKLQAINKELLKKNDELTASNNKLIKEIEDRIKIELKLKQSENTFRSFIEQSLEGICLIDKNGIIIEWNQAMSLIFDVPGERYLNGPVWKLDYDFLPPERKNSETRDELKTTISNYLNNESGKTFIADYEKFINGSIKYIHYRIFPIITDKGLIFGRINLDVTDRKNAERELEEYKDHLEQLVQERTLDLKRSEARIRLVMKSVPLAYYSYDPDDKASGYWYSEQIETLSGYKYQDFIDNTELWISRIHKEDKKQTLKSFSQIVEKGQYNCEYRWIKANEQTIWILDQAVMITHPENNQKQIIGCYLDFTEHKDAERAIIESEKNYREIFNSSSDSIFIHNAETGKVEDVNNTMLKTFKCTYIEALSLDVDVFLNASPPYDAENAFRHIQNAKNNGEERFEWLAHDTNGVYFWVDIILKRIRLNDELKILAVVRDINEKKIVETQIKYRSDFEKLIFSISSRFIDIPYKKVDDGIKNALKDICNFTNADTAYLFLYDTIHSVISLKNIWTKDEFKFKPEKYQKIIPDFSPWHTGQIMSNKIIRVNSLELLPPEAIVVKDLLKLNKVNSFVDIPINYQGNIIGFLGLASETNNREWTDDEVSLLQVISQTFINTLKRKESVEELYESEQSHREIYNATNEAILVCDIETVRIVDANKATLDMFGYSYNEMLTLAPEHFSQDSGLYTFENVRQIISSTISDGPKVIEWYAKKKDGTYIWTEISLRIVEIKGSKRLLAVFRDISERKKVQETLRENEEKYRLLIEGQTDLVIKINPGGQFTFVSPSFYDLFNKSENELLGRSIYPMIHQQDQESMIQTIKKLNDPPYTSYIEHRAFTRYGWRWIAWSEKAVLDQNKKLVEIIGVGRDITYQKGVEDALRRSEDRFRTIVQQLSDIVFIFDQKNVIMYDTPSIKNVLGYNEGELLGKIGFNYVHPDDVELIKEKIDELINNSNHFITLELRLKHADGRWISVEIIGINMLNHPSINGLVLTCRNITERRQIEKRILEAIIKTEEQERERFAKNLHDDLGPLLSSIKMYINSFSTINDKHKQEFIISQLNEIVKDAIITTKEVSNDLSPHILINYGLVSAIDSFLNKVPSGIKVNFESGLVSERFSNTIENSTYRIIKELVNNTLKHAQASKINIKLTEEENNLILNYTDNGIGFELSDLERNKTKGMGLSNIISRAKTLNSIYEMKTFPKKGFNFIIKIPINQSMD